MMSLITITFHTSTYFPILFYFPCSSHLYCWLPIFQPKAWTITNAPYQSCYICIDLGSEGDHLSTCWRPVAVLTELIFRTCIRSMRISLDFCPCWVSIIMGWLALHHRFYRAHCSTSLNPIGAASSIGNIRQASSTNFALYWFVLITLTMQWGNISHLNLWFRLFDPGLTLTVMSPCGPCQRATFGDGESNDKEPPESSTRVLFLVRRRPAMLFVTYLRLVIPFLTSWAIPSMEEDWTLVCAKIAASISSYSDVYYPGTHLTQPFPSFHNIHGMSSF